MNDIFRNFHFISDGTTTLVDSLCSFVREEITFGRLKGGDKFPTISEIGKATGLTFAQARRVTERLAREGYVHSRPHSGTVVRSRDGNVLHGRILFILPEEDICRYHPSQLMNTMSHKLTEAGYAFSIGTFSLGEDADLSALKREFLRAPDLVIAARATPQVQKCLVESGVNHIFAYGDKPESSDAPWIRFSPEEALSHFASHCEKVGVKHVVQVRFEGNETFDAQPALSEKGIESSWLTVKRGEGGKGRFDGVVRCSYETFAAMPREEIPDFLLFWNSFVAQGASIAFLDRGIHLPENVKVVTLADTGVGPIYPKPFTRFDLDPIEAGEKVAGFALSVLAKGRIPRPPQIMPQYVLGSTFVF